MLFRKGEQSLPFCRLFLRDMSHDCTLLAHENANRNTKSSENHPFILTRRNLIQVLSIRKHIVHIVLRNRIENAGKYRNSTNFEKI